QWSFDIPQFKPEVGFEFEFSAGKNDVQYLHRCKVIEVVPEKKLAYSWRYEGYAGDSLVTIELFAEGNQTRLRLTHTGLETFPKLPDFDRKNFAAGGPYLIGESLKAFVEQFSAGTKAGQAAGTADREIVLTRVFDAPRELVWQAMTDPKHVVNWWGPRGFTTTIEVMDVRPGGVWKHVMH